jgi:4-amino-4-deoxy-L-arabinose transferase-like glycosyltransferase
MSWRPAFRPARVDWLQAGAVALALFVVYAASAPRSIALEDDSLFVLSSYYLGIEHPPGYPLFTWAGHLFSKLPFGSVAYRVHLASALFGALSIGMLWLCARSLAAGRLPAYVAACALGLSPVFWSQSIIAEVYSLNTFFLLVLVYLGLRAQHDPRRLYWMALVFGLSLANHYPLMLLSAPAFLFLLWPVRMELLRRSGSLAWLVVLGAVPPYVWLVRRSWMALPVSFDGPLDTIAEIWFFISRAGYAGVDHSLTAGWFDRVQFLTFVGSQLFVQLAVAGTLLAAAGFAVQWRVLGRRMAAFLTVSFLMPSFVLVLLLGFDYDVFRKHIFHVYPLPAYAIAALWVALGFAWLVQRYSLRLLPARAAAAALGALFFAWGAYTNLRDDPDWAARYAQTVLKSLPQDAVVFGLGDADLIPLAYFHMVENWRPDITLYQSKGLILGNRLFHPLRTSAEQADDLVRELVEAQTGPVVFTLEAYAAAGRRERWLYAVVDPSAEPDQMTIDLPEEARVFFEQSIARPSGTNAWTAYFQSEMRRRYGSLLAQSLPRGQPSDERSRRHYELLAEDFYGAIGIAEGLLLNPAGFSAGAVGAFLERARERMPSDVPKEHMARYFSLRGGLRANMQDLAGGIADLQASFELYPSPDNPALKPLDSLYRAQGDVAAAEALKARVDVLKLMKR